MQHLTFMTNFNLLTQSGTIENLLNLCNNERTTDQLMLIEDFEDFMYMMIDDTFHTKKTWVRPIPSKNM